MFVKTLPHMIENLTCKLSLQPEKVEIAVAMLVITLVAIGVQALIYRAKNFTEKV